MAFKVFGCIELLKEKNRENAAGQHSEASPRDGAGLAWWDTQKA